MLDSVTPRGLSENKAEPFAAQPGNGKRGRVQVGRQEQRVVGTFGEADPDLLRRDGVQRRGLPKVPKAATRLGRLVAVADALGQQALEAAGPPGELQVAVDLPGHG